MAICLLMDYSLDGCLGKECLSNAMGLHLRVSMTIYIVFKYTISSRFKQHDFGRIYLKAIFCLSISCENIENRL